MPPFLRSSINISGMLASNISISVIAELTGLLMYDTYSHQYMFSGKMTGLKRGGKKREREGEREERVSHVVQEIQGTIFFFFY